MVRLFIITFSMSGSCTNDIDGLRVCAADICIAGKHDDILIAERGVRTAHCEPDGGSPAALTVDSRPCLDIRPS